MSGGSGVVVEDLDVNEVYDPSTDSWSTRASLPTSRYGLAVSVVIQRIFAIGGYIHEVGKGRTPVNEEYDPINDTWTTRLPMPTPRVWFSAATVNQKIYAIGGESTGANEEYTPPHARILLPIPYEAQGNTGWCWAASTAMVLRYYGKPVHVWDIGKIRWNPPLHVSEIETIIHEKYPGEFTTKIGSYSSVSEQIRRDIEGNISRGYPAILQICAEKRHMVVVTGYNSSGFFIHDPSGFLFEGLGRSTFFPFIHKFVTWEELEPFVCKGILGDDVFLVVEGAPSPLDATLSLVNGAGGVRTIHDLDYEKGVYIDYGGWCWHLGLYWNNVGWHAIAFDSKDILIFAFRIFNHRSYEIRFDFHLQIEGEDDVVYYNKTLDIDTPAFDVKNPSDTVILKSKLIEGQKYIITSQIRHHLSGEVVDSITLPPIYYGDRWLLFMTECPVRMLVTDPDIDRVIFNRDFKENEVYLESNGINAPTHPYTFLSKLSCSDDYCVAVIIWDDYSYLQRRLEGEKSPEEKKKSLELTLWPYFPGNIDQNSKSSAHSLARRKPRQQGCYDSQKNQKQTRRL